MFVRPHLEHCVSVWNPSYVGDILAMEKTQNRFTRMLRHGPVLTPQERNNLLGITSHRDRRLRGDLINMYKLGDDQRLFRPAVERRTRGHSKKVFLESTNNNLRRYSFAVRSVREWNALPENVINAPSLNSFKNRLDRTLFNNG